MTHSKVRALLVSILLGVPSLGFAQSAQIDLAAATALTNGVPEVRLRLQIESGWLPVEGIKIYRDLGGSRTLVYRSRPVSDADVDGVVERPLRGKGLWSKAVRPMSVSRGLDFRVVRPPSSAARFNELKVASDRILQRRVSEPSGAAIAGDLRRVAELRAQPVARMAPRPGLAAPAALNVQDRETFLARSKLMLSSLVRAEAAQGLGLGAVDRGVKRGDAARYTVVAIQSGADGAVLDTVTIVVGTDPQPPAPTGMLSQQPVDDDGEPSGAVKLRWDRLAADLEARLLNAAYLIERRSGRAASGAGQGTTAPGGMSGPGSLPTTPGGISNPGGLPATTIPARSPLLAADWIRVHARPIMIAAINGDEEPVSFFTDDSLETPGTYTYRVALIDGFGRQSGWTEQVVTLVDWRRPTAPGDPSGFVDVAVRDAAGKVLPPTKRAASVLSLERMLDRPRDLGPWSSLIVAGGRASVSVTWMPVLAPRGLTVRYRVSRVDIEAPNPAPVLLTPQPVEGVVFPPTPEQMAAQVHAALLEAEIAGARARLASPIGAALGPVLRKEIADRTARLRRLRLIMVPRCGYADAGVRIDGKYRYLVRAIFTETGLESDDAVSGVVPVPTPAPPPVVQGLRSAGFTASHQLTSAQLVNETTGAGKERGFIVTRGGLARVAPAAKGYRPLAPAAPGRFTGASRLKGRTSPSPATTAPQATTSSLGTPGAAPIGPGGSLANQTLLDPIRSGIVNRSPVFARADLSKLRLNLMRGRDDGGVVALSWTSVPNLKDVTYTVQRKYSNLPYVDVGTTTPNRTEFRDVLPRSMERAYTYRVVPVSRWGVVGAPSAAMSTTVPSTVQPGRPNLVAVAPDMATDRAIRVRLDPNPRDESVVRYRVYRDGAEVATIAATASDSVELSHVDAQGLTPNKVYAYKVVAETGAGLKSEESRALSAKALKIVATAPGNVQGTADARGVTVTWSGPSDAASFAIQRRGASGPALILAGSLGKTPARYLDVTAIRGASYTYEVIATDTFGNVSPPATVSVSVPQ